MDFYFLETEKKLTASVISGGLGLSSSDIEGVIRWQRDMNYTFNWHTGTHGDRCVYMKTQGSRSKNLPCIWLEGSKKLTGRNNPPDDAIEVVTANQQLFLKAFNNIYSNGPSSNIVVSVPRFNFACTKCGDRKNGYESSIALGFAIGCFPPKCSRKMRGGIPCDGWFAQEL